MVLPPDDRDRRRVAILGNAEPFRIVIDVRREPTPDHPAGRFQAEARWDGDETIVAACQAPDAVAALRGAADACAQVIGRQEFAARLESLAEHLQSPADAA